MNVKNIVEQKINSFMDRNPKLSVEDFAYEVSQIVNELCDDFETSNNFQFKFRLIKLVDKKVMLTCDVI